MDPVIAEHVLVLFALLGTFIWGASICERISNY